MSGCAALFLHDLITWSLSSWSRRIEAGRLPGQVMIEPCRGSTKLSHSRSDIVWHLARLASSITGTLFSIKKNIKNDEYHD
ncbi:hypothetical protein BpHYR1_016855 [Brachionus plicatilis]|uniref:Uncharacterized protein n=1 Tax=Brachionus plicatilis TaxID=10195 RepID=A0A3M7PTI1_BRAPC|nr:hypothetical protein BpHYR1_016855 [Brachionus plicatilis]